MKSIQYHNEKGNVLPKVRSAFKIDTVNFLRKLIGTAGVTVSDGPKGTLAILRATDENGDPIYAKIEVTMVQTLEVKEKTASTVTKAPDAPIVIPSLYQE